MDDIQILVETYSSRGVYKYMGLIRWHSSLSLFCYHAFFSKKLFKILAYFSSYMHVCTLNFKNLHRVCTACIQDKRLFIQIWDILCEACSQWGELASIMRKGRPFLITNANSFHWLQDPQKMPQIRNVWVLLSYTQCKLNEGIWNVHSYWILPKSETNFLKRMHDNRKIKESYATKSYP